MENDETRSREEQQTEVERIVGEHADADIKLYTRSEAKKIPKNSWTLLATVKFNDSTTMDTINQVKEELRAAEYVAVMEEIYDQSVLSVSTSYDAATKK